MQYKCGACGFDEVIWNSRDGVTPFVTTCSRCGLLEMQHVRWYEDVFAPNHVLTEGQRYFCDVTREDVQEHYTKVVNMYPQYVPEGSTIEEHIQKLVESFHYEEGQPIIKTYKANKAN